MKKTLINQIVRGALLVPLCLVVFSFVSCSSDDEDDSSSVSTADDGYEVSGKINGYYYVDLGLSVKWATCNIGADSPEDYGNYYAWGETETKDSYTTSNSVTYHVEIMDDIAGNAEYDAATANWGGSWRMPTYGEMKELVDNCTWTWTTENDVNGYLVTGPNTNSIFLPAAGSCEKLLYDAGSYGYYWSSTPDSSKAYYYYSYRLCFDSSGHYVYAEGSRSSGQSVRPVSE